jgi:parvulin-like peptidyl-prolyl isomerase
MRMSFYNIGLASIAMATAAALANAKAPRAPTARVAATVNGEAIPLADVDAIVKARPSESIKPTEAERLDLQREALDMLIDDALMRQFLRKHAPPVRATEVNKKIGELQASLKTQGQTLEAYYRESGQTEAQLRDTITTLVQRSAFIAEHLPDAAVRKYYDDNREFFDQVTVRVSHILIRPVRGSTPAQVAAERAKLEALRQQIVAGKVDFAEAAKRYSHCSSAPNGGDIGFFPRKGAVEEPFARAAFVLKPNEISEVVQTSYGLHLIRLTERKSGQPSDFKKIAEKVRDLAGEEMLMGILASERQSAQIEIKLDNPETKPQPAAPRPRFSGR